MINESEYQKVLDFGKNLFKGRRLELLISPEIQQKELIKLNAGVREETFFFIIDLLKGKIIESGGLQNVGIDKQAFTLKTYFEMMPSTGIANLLTLLGKQTFLLSNLKYIGFLKPTYIVNLPLKVYPDSDTLYLVKRSIAPWQITKEGQIVQYLSYFTIVKEYDHEELNPRFIGIPEDLRKSVEKHFAVGFTQLPAKENKFSPKEIVILNLYSNNPNDSNKQIADKARIKISTLNSYNKQIIKKAREMFGEDLPVRTACDVASYLKKNGLFG